MEVSGQLQAQGHLTPGEIAFGTHLTFNGRTFKLPGALCGQDLIGPKSLKWQTFRKNYIFSVLCSLEIRTKNNPEDNKIIYIYTQRAIFTNEN
jgi:hypothetical protein